MGKKAQRKRAERDANVVPSVNAEIARIRPPRTVRIVPEKVVNTYSNRREAPVVVTVDEAPAEPD